MSGIKIRNIILIICDVLAINVAYIFVFLLRFDFDIDSASFDSWFSGYAEHIFEISICVILVFALCGMYRKSRGGGFGRFALKTLAAVALSQLAVRLALLAFNGRMPSGIYPAVAAVLFAYALLSRMAAGLHRAESRRESVKREIKDFPGDKFWRAFDEGESFFPANLKAEARRLSRALSAKTGGRVVMLTEPCLSAEGLLLFGELAGCAPRRLILCETEERAELAEKLIEHTKRRAPEVELVSERLPGRGGEEERKLISKYTPHIIFAFGEENKGLSEASREYAVQSLIYIAKGEEGGAEAAVRGFAEHE